MPIADMIREGCKEAREHITRGKLDLALSSLRWVQSLAADEGIEKVDGLDDLLLRVYSSLAKFHTNESAKISNSSGYGGLRRHQTLAGFYASYLND